MTVTEAARDTRRQRTLVRVSVAGLLLALATSVVGPMASPGETLAVTASDVEAKLLSLVNAERTRRGLVPLRKHPGLVQLSGERADYMASIGKLAHISCLSCTLNSRGIQWYTIGEVIAWSGSPWGDQAAQSIFSWWMNSSGHRALLMSSRLNYVGFGAAYRSSNGTTWASGVLTESVDRTSPWAKMGTASRSGSTLTWKWSGADTKLQTHTSGLKSYDVQYRVGSGSWSTIRSGTTSTSLSLTRGTGTYGVRVRSRDNRGYLSAWTAEVRISVP